MQNVRNVRCRTDTHDGTRARFRKSEDAMTHQQEIVSLKGRLEKAEADRDAWRATGDTERYLESYCLVEALQRRLDACVGDSPTS
jgi:hypothetical protein